ncbi:hypothetical protein HQ520_01310 [bacterium]|nr:hypothetical protein [bacterium]
MTTTSTMLVWPVKDGKAGRPIRVNGATAWWAWPARYEEESQRVGVNTPWSAWPAAMAVPRGIPTTPAPRIFRVIGKNLKMGPAQPVAYLRGGGKAEWINVRSAETYHLEIELPHGLKTGHYQVWVHNGSGGSYGWSEPVSFEVVPPPSPAPHELAEFRVDDYGAHPNTPDDDYAAIQATIDAAAQAGGGKVLFSEGDYLVSHHLEVPANVPGGIHLIGVGMGDHDPATHAISGNRSAILPDPSVNLPLAILRILSPHCRVTGLSLVNGANQDTNIWGYSDQGQIVLGIYAPDAVIEDCRIVMYDALDYSIPNDDRVNVQLRYGAFQIHSPGEANIVVQRCEVHSVGSGIQFNDYTPDHGSTTPPPQSTNYVRISDCAFRGYFEGYYKIETNQNYGSLGSRHSGIVNYNAKNVIVERCDLAGADKANRVMINRTMLCFNTSIRHVYIAHNNSHEMGIRSPAPPAYVNQGESILFHFRYPYGGYFDVITADAQSVTVNPDDPRNAGTVGDVISTVDRTGSRVLPEVGQNDHWVVFIATGKGVGQFRVVSGRENLTGGHVKLLLDKPWRVMPDTTSRLTLTASYRENIVYDNTLDTTIPDNYSNAAGTMFWFNAMNNIIAENTYRNFWGGSHFSSSFRQPCAWNLVRGTRYERTVAIATERGGAHTSNYYTSDFYNNPAFDSDSDCRGWFGGGNVVRSIQAHGGAICASFGGTGGGSYASVDLQNNVGMMFDVLENSRFENADDGVRVSPPYNWLLFRNDHIPNNPPINDTSGRAQNILVINPD